MLPQNDLYKNSQLRHAVQAGLGNSATTTSDNKIASSFGCLSSSSGVISNIYRALLDLFLIKFRVRSEEKWEREIGPLEENQWGRDSSNDSPSFP